MTRSHTGDIHGRAGAPEETNPQQATVAEREIEAGL
jgi:hypothetical protein